VFKLDVRPVLLIGKPAVMTQKFQNFPNRHSISIRVFYTYVKKKFFKGFFDFLTAYFLSISCPAVVRPRSGVKFWSP
jgi:hypothetical protein